MLNDVCFGHTGKLIATADMGHKAAGQFASQRMERQFPAARYPKASSSFFAIGRCWPKENDDGYFTI